MAKGLLLGKGLLRESAYVQGTALAHKGKGAGGYTPPDVHAQAEEGALDHPKPSGKDKDFGVMSARAGNGSQLPQPDRCAHLVTLPTAHAFATLPFHIQTDVNTFEYSVISALIQIDWASKLITCPHLDAQDKF